MNNNKELYLDNQSSAYIITALTLAVKIVEIPAQQNECKTCPLLQKLKSILNTLNLTQNENQQIAKQAIELIIGLFDEQLDCKDEVCNKVWELLQEMFKNPIIAEDIVLKLKQILRDLQIKLAREE